MKRAMAAAVLPSSSARRPATGCGLRGIRGANRRGVLTIPLRGAATSAALVIWLHASLASALPRYEKSARVRWADEAGSVTVSPVSVSRWEDAAGRLQPKFSLTPQDAFASAIPTTMLSDEKLSSIFQMALGLALPTHNVTTTFHTTGPQDARQTSVDQVDTRSRGTPPSSVPGLIDRNAAGLAGLPETALQGDPALRYLAATALYQEVQLLNHYVEDAVRFQGGQAFLVRLQLSVLPGRRALPYDVISDITIHPQDIQALAGLAQTEPDEHQVKCEKSAATPEEHDTLQVVPLIVTDSLEGLAASRSTDDAKQFALALAATIAGVGANANFGQTLETIRRAVGQDTNSLLTLARLSDDTVRVRLGASQSPRYGQTMLPRTHNISLLVIYRPCNPAAIKANGEQAFLTAVTRASFVDSFTGETLPYEPAAPRLLRLTRELNRKYNNNLSYLDYAGLYMAVARQDHAAFQKYFEDRISGSLKRKKDCKDLSNPPGLETRLALLLTGRVPTDPIDTTALAPLFPKPIFHQDPGSDKLRDTQCLREALAASIAPNTLWTDLQAIRPFPEYSYTRIPVVLEDGAPRLPPEQDALVSVEDDAVSVTLYDGLHLAAVRQPTATLSFITPPASNAAAVAKPKPQPKAGRKRQGKAAAAAAAPVVQDPPAPITLRARSVTVSSDGTSITATFPPIAALVPETASKKVKFARLELGVGRLESPWDPKKTCELPCHSVPARQGVALAAEYDRLHAVIPPNKPKADPEFVLAAPASVVVGPDGEARLTVFIQQKPAKPAAEGEEPKAKPLPTLTVDGAGVVSATSGSAVLAQTAWGWQIVGPGAVTLILDGMIPAQTVTLGLARVNDKGTAEAVAEPLRKPVYERKTAAKE